MGKYKFLDPTPRDFQSANLRCGQRISISIKFPGDLEVMLILLFQEHTFRNIGLNNTTDILSIYLDVTLVESIIYESRLIVYVVTSKTK